MSDTREVDFETAVDATIVADVQISPDGQQVLYVTTAASHSEDGPTNAIWLVNAGGGPARRITTSEGADGFPRWSPDGKTIAFLSDRKERGKSQLDLLNCVVNWHEDHLNGSWVKYC